MLSSGHCHVDPPSLEDLMGPERKGRIQHGILNLGVFVSQLSLNCAGGFDVEKSLTLLFGPGWRAVFLCLFFCPVTQRPLGCLIEFSYSVDTVLFSISWKNEAFYRQWNSNGIPCLRKSLQRISGLDVSILGKPRRKLRENRACKAGAVQFGRLERSRNSHFTSGIGVSVVYMLAWIASGLKEGLFKSEGNTNWPPREGNSECLLAVDARQCFGTNKQGMVLHEWRAGWGLGKLLDGKQRF